MKKALTFAILLMFAVPLYAQDQQPNTAKLKADAEKVVRIISGDKAKSQIYCQIADLGNEIDQEKDSKKAQVLFGKMNELQKQLGPEYIAFLADSQDVDPDSKDGQDIVRCELLQKPRTTRCYSLGSRMTKRSPSRSSA